MASTYPRIRIPGPLTYTSSTAESGVVEHHEARLIVRDLVRIVFFVPRDHFDIATSATHALDSYLRAVETHTEALSEYTCCDWETAKLSASGWERIRNTLNPTEHRHADDYTREETFHLKDGADPYFGLYGAPDSGFSFEYHARIPWREPLPTSVSVLRATLPTEFLEERGARFVHDLALDMASGLPFASGHAGLALDVAYSSKGRLDTLRPLITRYPGFDIRDAGIRDNVGTRVDGTHWMNFLGPLVLGALGGPAGLRVKLQAPSVSLMEMSGERALVTLGPAPEAGEQAHGQSLPAYRAFAHALEPWLEPFPWSHLGRQGRAQEEQELRRWWRRFLD